MYKVTFKFENSEDVTVFAAFGESLLEVARKTNVAIDAPCSGNASCGKCRVKLVDGELDSKQTRHISDEEYAQGWRLACCSKINADVAVLVPDIASAYRSRMKVADLSSPDEVKIFDNIKQSITEAGIELKNNLESIHVKMDVPTLDDTMPDNERLTRAIREITGMQRVKLPYSVIHKMAQVLVTVRSAMVQMLSTVSSNPASREDRTNFRKRSLKRRSIRWYRRCAVRRRSAR